MGYLQSHTFLDGLQSDQKVQHLFRLAGLDMGLHREQNFVLWSGYRSCLHHFPAQTLLHIVQKWL